VRKIEPAFWDASAIVALCVWQPPSARIRRIALGRGRIVVWWATVVEVRSALARLVRAGEMTTEDLGAALRRLGRLRQLWSEVLPTERVRGVAENMPDAYGLTAADSMQLAAALVWCGERPRGRPFVILDERLSVAATKVGFTVIGLG
jgi:predicted nucleic acid-binding protein